MNPVVKQKWLAELRSGNYKQGRKLLKQKTEFCCLGVLCDIHAKEYAGVWIKLEENEPGKEVYSYDKQSCVLPNCVIEWAGIGHSIASCPIMFNGTSQTLAYINDTIKLDFNQIADIIEEQL